MTNDELLEVVTAMSRGMTDAGAKAILRRGYPIIEQQVRKRVAGELRELAKLPLHRPHRSSLEWAADGIWLTADTGGKR